MTAIIKNPGQPAFTRQIENTLTAFQQLVGGYIQTINLPGRIIMIVNEEGKLMNLKPNFRFGNDLIVGTAVFVSADGEEFVGLSERQENYIWRMMSCVL